MKKEEIIYIRIMSVIAASAVLALILIVGAGSGLFQSIVNKINNNTVEASLYNLYFYKGLNVIYRTLYSVTLFSLVLTTAAMLVKLDGAGLYAVVSSALSVITGLYIVLCRVFEGNIGLYRFINNFYIGETGEINPISMLGFSWIAGILLIIIGALCLFLVKSARLDRIKAFGGNSPSYLGVFAPVLIGSIFFECIREIIIAGVCNISNTYIQSTYLCIKEYYFADTFLFDMPYVTYLIITVIGVMLLGKMKLTLHGRLDIGWILPLLLTVIAVVRSVIYYFNSPPLFGYLTVDEKLCDYIESAYPVYMILYILDMIFLMAAVKLFLDKKCSIKKMLTVCCNVAAVSIIGILIAVFTAKFHTLGLECFYIICATADAIGLFCLFYSGNIRRSHH